MKSVLHLKQNNSTTTPPKPPKIIFLDVDGVLNRAFAGNEDFDEKCLEIFKDLVVSTGAKIVVHSSWKYSPEMLEKLRLKLAEYELEIYDVTPDFKMDRDVEILQWMKDHNFDKEHWVMLDDWDYRNKFGNRNIVTCSHGRIGLDEQWAEEAKKLLTE